MFKRLICYLRGCVYRPAYLWYRNKATYTCYCCGVRTKAMNRKEHALFNATHKPTWGEYGSNSQDY